MLVFLRSWYVYSSILSLYDDCAERIQRRDLRKRSLVPPRTRHPFIYGRGSYFRTIFRVYGMSRLQRTAPDEAFVSVHSESALRFVAMNDEYLKLDYPNSGVWALISTNRTLIMNSELCYNM